ncbi:MAG: HAD family phosphatase [Lachnospiraceae bacterium]|nr:HAD family phosphatase [Lachnospiraceae bacterium]
MGKTVIFDIGGVLACYDWRDFMRTLFKDEETVDIVYDTMFKHGIWDELDRGVWSEDELLSAFIKIRPDYEKEIREFYEKSPQALQLADYAKDWIKSVKAKGCRALYLSNYSEHVIEGNYSALGFLHLMDGGVFSCYVHKIKPNSDIYECICEKYGLDKRDCIFIDDHEANVQGALDFGMNGVLFKSYEQARHDVEELIG